MLILKTIHTETVIEKYSMFIEILQKINSREDLIRFSDQYKLYFNLILKQLIRANELEKYASLKNRINELNNYFFNDNF